MSIRHTNPTANGQGALVAIAVTMLIALVLGATSMTGLMQMNSKRTVVTRQSLQTYYVAQAGIQEALATRMVPRSNALNFMSTMPGKAYPYYSASGLVYEDPVNRKKLIGVYRYLIVGGDPSKNGKDPNGNYYSSTDMTVGSSSPKPRLVTFQTSPPDSPFYVISNGLTCLKDNGEIGRDRFIGATTANPAKTMGQRPVCEAGYTLDETTIVSRVQLESETPNVRDKLNQNHVYRNYVIGTQKNYTTGVKKIPLPAKAFVPGAGWVNEFDFESAWMHSATTNSPAKPTRIVFFDFATGKIYLNQALGSGASTNIGSVVPPKASIMLYFDGPVDFRSFSISDYDPNLKDCKTTLTPTTSNCAIQLKDSLSGTIYSGMTVVPIMPYLTKVLLLAPLGNNLSSNKGYQLVIRRSDIYSFSGSRADTTNHTINFNTCPASGGPAYCY